MLTSTATSFSTQGTRKLKNMLTKFLFFILFIYFKILILTHRILKTHLTPEIQNPIKGFPSNIPRNGWKQEYLDLVGFGNGGTPLQDTIQE